MSHINQIASIKFTNKMKMFHKNYEPHLFKDYGKYSQKLNLKLIDRTKEIRNKFIINA